jgi:hypothetical protein
LAVASNNAIVELDGFREKASMADAHGCSNCGADLPAGATEGICSSCQVQRSTAGPTSAPSEANTGDAVATGDWSPDPTDPTRTTDGSGAARELPRGTTVPYFGDYEPRGSSDAAAREWFIRLVRSASTEPWL